MVTLTDYQREQAAINRALRLLRWAAKHPGVADATPGQRAEARRQALARLTAVAR